MKRRIIYALAAALLIGGALIVSSMIRKSYDDDEVIADDAGSGWGCSHDSETYEEPTLQNGTYYLNGDTNSPYGFKIDGTGFAVIGDTDKVIEDFGLSYKTEHENSVSSYEPKRNEADNDARKANGYPTYKELKQQLGETMRTEIFTLHELDDEIFIYVWHGDDKMFGFEYYSDHEFKTADMRFILTN